MFSHQVRREFGGTINDANELGTRIFGPVVVTRARKFEDRFWLLRFQTVSARAGRGCEDARQDRR